MKLFLFQIFLFDLLKALLQNQFKSLDQMLLYQELLKEAQIVIHDTTQDLKRKQIFLENIQRKKIDENSQQKIDIYFLMTDQEKEEYQQNGKLQQDVEANDNFDMLYDMQMKLIENFELEQIDDLNISAKDVIDCCKKDNKICKNQIELFQEEQQNQFQLLYEDLQIDLEEDQLYYSKNSSNFDELRSKINQSLQKTQQLFQKELANQMQKLKAQFLENYENDKTQKLSNP